MAGVALPPGTGHTIASALPGLVAVALWFALLAVVLVATRPAEVRGAPATQDLGGDEPPAVVSYLANGWTVTEDAVEATLLDLAARDHLEFRQLSDDPMATTVHLVDDRARPDDPLTSYEESVLGRVAAVAVGGVVPVTALTFRDKSRSDAWWSAFRSAVADDARARGLSRPRISRRVVGVLSLSALVPAVVVLESVRRASSGDLGLALALAVLTFGVLSGIGARNRGERDTPAGREVAARWLGLRRYLKVDEAFQALPPAAVAVWDRYLAYGDALGMARVCAAVLDLGLGDRRRVWSSYGGTWHQVRVRYPYAGWTFGRTASGIGVGAVATGAVGYGVLRLREVVQEGLPGGRARTVATALGVLGVLVVVRAGYRLVRAVVDAATPRILEGEALWLAVARSSTDEDDDEVPLLYHLAVDDGTRTERGYRTTAWALPVDLAQSCTPGDRVRLTVRRWTRRVLAVDVQQHRSVDAVAGRTPASSPPPGSERTPARPAPAVALQDLLAAARGGPPAAVPEALAEMAGPALAGLLSQAVLAEVADAVGARPEDVTVRQVTDGATSGVVFDVHRGDRSVPALTLVTATGDEGELLLAAHRGRGRELAGVGSEAWSGPGWALARAGDLTVRLGVSPSYRERASDALPAVLASALATAGATP